MLRHNGLDIINGTRCASIEGLLGRDDDVNALRCVIDLADIAPGTPWLIDNRQSPTRTGMLEVVRLERFFREHVDLIGNTRVAIVVDAPEARAMARVLARRARGLSLEIGAFLSLDEASRWLAGNEPTAARSVQHWNASTRARQSPVPRSIGAS